MARQGRWISELLYATRNAVTDVRGCSHTVYLLLVASGLALVLAFVWLMVSPSFRRACCVQLILGT